LDSSNVVEREAVRAMRWWPAAELAETREQLIPLSLAMIVRRYVLEGGPSGELEVETLVD
jgi:hypothetical protein